MAVYFGMTVSFVECSFIKCGSFADCSAGLTHVCSSAVGRTLYDSDHLHQEQPDRFLLGLCGCGCKRGSGVPPAMVSSATGYIIL